MKMNLLAGLMMTISIGVNVQAKESNALQIIPEPQKTVLSAGQFTLSGTTVVVCNPSDDSKSVGDNLVGIIQNSLGVECRISDKYAPHQSAIVLTINKNSAANPEAYQLKIEHSKILISASSAQGLFYGVQTLRQMLPVQKTGAGTCSLPCLTITDEPRFAYRGLHLDVSRHFFDKAFIFKYIDLMAMYKFNKFHWHLTDDQGWRIEVKKYPKLTSVSSVRVDCKGDTVKGFYTQQDIREVVAYAASRYVEVIPEIEMPGHAQAALAAFPALSCSGGPFKVETTWGVFNDVFCAGNDKTFDFLCDVLDEVIPLFPGKYFHIGGDECPKVRWERCVKCQARIKAESLKNEHELQGYFMRRIEKHLMEKGKKMIGWEEILEGGVSKTATVMSWTSVKGGLKAASLGNEVVMCPQKECYFDHCQGVEAEEPPSFGHGQFLPLKSVYNFDPIPAAMPADQRKFVLGGQANVWSEHIPDTRQVEYMLFPRALAMSECLWSDPGKKNFERFECKVALHTERLRSMGVVVADSWNRASTKEKWEKLQPKGL